MTFDTKSEKFQFILMVLAIIADIALIVNIIHHW
jgi:hypothetical protein